MMHVSQQSWQTHVPKSKPSVVVLEYANRAKNLGTLQNTVRMEQNNIMRLWLDDLRPTPDETWHRVWTALAAIECLSKRAYTEVSLDHDLGACKQCLADYDGDDIPSDCEHNGNGYQVLCWIEEQVATDPTFPIPTIHVHTDNASARQRMMLAVRSIEHIRQQRVGGG